MKPYAGRKNRSRPPGSVLVVVVLLLLVLSIFSLGVLKSAEGAHVQSIQEKRESAALAAAEAAYEKAVFTMSQQNDLLTTLAKGSLSDTMIFPDSAGSYTVNMATFMQSKPVFEVTAVGTSGTFQKTISTYLVQAVNGWAMGRCQVPTGATGLSDVYFVTGEYINMPIEINKQSDSPDVRDIKISGSPVFAQPVNVSESRYSDAGSDKYWDVLSTFTSGVFFNQPQTRITDEDVIGEKVERFKDSTDSQFKFKPAKNAPLTNAQAAVQLEFFIESGRGKVRITNNCTVRGFKQDSDSKTYDFKIKKNSDGEEFERYPIYAYHVRDEDADDNGDRFVVDLEDTYVSQEFGGFSSRPGGQIFVDGNVIIGSGDNHLGDLSDVVQGQITIVATENIWIADSITVSDLDNEGVNYPRQADGLPGEQNPNILGLVAQGIIKVVDPGMSEYSYVDGTPIEPNGYKYVPIGRPDNPWEDDDTDRYLPDPTVVEASVTVGGGGWGAENVERNYYGGRKQDGGYTDDLILRGNITEAIRGVVGRTYQDGYLKVYHWDPRLQTGILPGNIWLKGKYVPVPGGWHEAQYVQNQ